MIFQSFKANVTSKFGVATNTKRTLCFVCLVEYGYEVLNAGQTEISWIYFMVVTIQMDKIHSNISEPLQNLEYRNNWAKTNR